MIKKNYKKKRQNTTQKLCLKLIVIIKTKKEIVDKILDVYENY